MSLLDRVMIIYRENTMVFNFLGIKFYNVNQLIFFFYLHTFIMCGNTLLYIIINYRSMNNPV